MYYFGKYTTFPLLSTPTPLKDAIMSVTILKYRSNFTPLHSKGSTVIKRGLYVGEGGGVGAGGGYGDYIIEHMIGLLFLGKAEVA